MKVLRTPEERFSNLPDFTFEPYAIDVGGPRMEDACVEVSELMVKFIRNTK